MNAPVHDIISIDRPRAIDYDVIIVGAGMVGATLGSALIGSGLRVAVVELNPVSGASRDPRVSVVTAGNRRLLESAGVWPSWASADPVAIESVVMTDGNDPRQLRFSAQRLGIEAIGYAFENKKVLARLHQQLLAAPEVEVVSPAKVTHVEQRSDYARVTVDADGQPRMLTGRLVIGADGARSTVRHLSGIKARTRLRGLSCVVFSIGFTEDHADRCFEFLQPSFAMLPLAGDGSGPRPSQVVWTVTDAEAAELKGLDDGAFLQRLYARFGPALERFGAVQSLSRRASFPVRRLHANRYARGRTVLIGDAAHVVTPFCGQGLNMGLRDVDRLVRLLRDAGPDAGCARLRRRYARRRRANGAMLWTMEFGAWWCNQGGPMLTWLRRATMARVERRWRWHRAIGHLATGIPAPKRPRVQALEA